MVVSALTERPSDPGISSLPSTVSDSRFGLNFTVMFLTEHGCVRFDGELPEPRNILAAVNSLGFQVWFGFYIHVPHRARSRALRQSAPRTQGHSRCRQQSRIPGLVWFLQSCSTLSAAECALTERSSDPGTSSLPSTVSDSRFGLVSCLQSCSTLSTVVFALTKRSVNPGTFFVSSTGSDSRFRLLYFLQIT
jgi:hypothetical protein